MTLLKRRALLDVESVRFSPEGSELARLVALAIRASSEPLAPGVG